ncbi:MAG: hypothetical protein OHK0017_00070 [Patescibacteria group bacterium]
MKDENLDKLPAELKLAEQQEEPSDPEWASTPEPIVPDEGSVVNELPKQARNQLFVSTTLLFCLPIILLLNEIGSKLKYQDIYTFTLLIIGGGLILRSYLVSFLALNEIYFNRRWLFFIFNLILTMVTFWSSYHAISSLTQTTFPFDWFVAITAANLLYTTQIWINRLYDSQYIQIQLMQIIFSMMSIGALAQMLFDGTRWFLTLLALIMAVFELYLIFGTSQIIRNIIKNLGN